MLRYMLDTSVCIDVIRESGPLHPAHFYDLVASWQSRP